MRWHRRQALASKDSRVQKVCIWTPDKDLAQCVSGDLIVQVDRKERGHPERRRRASQVWSSSRVDPRLSRASSATVLTAIPGIAGIGPKGAASLIARYGRIEDFPTQGPRGAPRSLAAVIFKKAGDTSKPMRRSFTKRR